MNERYDRDAAAHYAAYRPQLHSIILRKALGDSTHFEIGIDIGCGTGISVLALVEHCQRAYGVEPNISMLRRAAHHDRVNYIRGSGDSVPLPDSTADVVTFAGSLYYADSEATRSEVRRLSQSGTRVVVYDFNLFLNPVLTRCEIKMPKNSSNYDHRTNFSGRTGFVELSTVSERVVVEMSIDELAHVVLSDSNRFDHLAEVYRQDDPFTPLVHALSSLDEMVAITTAIYYSSYSLEYT